MAYVSTQVNGYKVNFAKYGKHDVFEWLSNQTYFPSFSEGWATYSEYPLVGKDIDIYRDDIMGRYGMIQQQVNYAMGGASF